jgi:predicted transcriptional regulator
MLEEGVDHLPVVEDGRVVGMCTRTDVLHTRRAVIEQDQTQQGMTRLGHSAAVSVVPAKWTQAGVRPERLEPVPAFL